VPLARDRLAQRISCLLDFAKSSTVAVNAGRRWAYPRTEAGRSESNGKSRQKLRLACGPLAYGPHRVMRTARTACARIEKSLRPPY
jgi:hypothetical protein